MASVLRLLILYMYMYLENEDVYYVSVNKMIYSELLTKQRQLRKMTDTMCPL